MNYEFKIFWKKIGNQIIVVTIDVHCMDKKAFWDIFHNMFHEESHMGLERREGFHFWVNYAFKFYSSNYSEYSYSENHYSPFIYPR